MNRVMTLFLPVLFFFVLSSTFAQEQPTLDSKVIKELSLTMKAIFDARLADDRAKELESKQSLAAQITEIEKEHGVDDLLKYPDLWHRIREGTINLDNRIFKRTGRGFEDATFADPTEIVEREYSFYLSLPKSYDPESEERLPVIIFLHPEIEGRGKPDREVQKMLETVYPGGQILENYIILAPVGPMIGDKRKKTLVDAGKNWEELEYGRKTAFMAIRVILENMAVDRTRIFLDGIGAAGLSAFRYATWYPSFFAGAAGRNAPLQPLAMENAVNIPFLYLSASDNESTLADAGRKWAEAFKAGDMTGVTFSEGAGTALEPAPETNAFLFEWLAKVKKNTTPQEITLKSADLQTSGAYWLRATELNAGLNMSLDDPDHPVVYGKVDRDANSIILESKRVLGIQIYLNDKILDLNKKVTVILNGRNRFEGKVERNLDKMLDLIYFNPAGDFEVYCNFLSISDEG